MGKISRRILICVSVFALLFILLSSGAVAEDFLMGILPVSSDFFPLTAFTYGELEDKTYKKLKACPNCQPAPGKAVLEEINQTHLESSPGEVMSYWKK